MNYVELHSIYCGRDGLAVLSKALVVTLSDCSPTVPRTLVHNVESVKTSSHNSY